MDNIRVEYYTATWCRPCQTVRPIVEELKAEGWNIEKIDVDQNRVRASEAQIQGVPTFIIYRDNILVKRFSGARPKAGIEGELRQAAG